MKSLNKMKRKLPGSQKPITMYYSVLEIAWVCAPSRGSENTIDISETDVNERFFGGKRYAVRGAVIQHFPSVAFDNAIVKFTMIDHGGES
jgi:hypothetical protein